jgi:hypothetical protein
VDDFVKQNPRAREDSQVVGLPDHDLVRVNFYGQHPEDPKRRLCVIGIGDDEDRATKAAKGAWFDYHASVLFTGQLE